MKSFKIFAVVIFLSFSFLFILIYRLLNKNVFISSVEIPPNKGGYYILNLEKRIFKLNLIERQILKLYIKIFYAKKKLKYGKYLINTTLNPIEFVNYLYNQKISYEKLTIYPGEDLFDIANKLELKRICSKKSFLNLAFDKSFLKNLIGQDVYSLEGFVKPDTYLFSIYTNPKEVIKILFKEFEKNFFKFVKSSNNLKKYFNLTLNQTTFKSLSQAQFKKVYDTMKIASILEKETANNTEKFLISSVIYNRLKMNMSLQMDPTFFYQKKFEKYFPKKKDIFDTYKIKGLPPSPICNFKLLNLVPAAFPKETNYLFFVRKSKYSHVFSKDYEKHLENIKKYYKKEK